MGPFPKGNWAGGLVVLAYIGLAFCALLLAGVIGGLAWIVLFHLRIV